MTASARLFDETVRVETIIWIPGAVADFEATPDAFREDFVDDLVDGHNKSLLESLPCLRPLLDGDFPATEDVAESLMSTPGFLVKAATPVRTFYDDGNASHFSWGYYRTEWLYAASESDIETVVIAWAQAEVERQKAKQAAKAIEAAI